MEHDQQSGPPIPAFIRRLMPDASQAELEEATENVLRYLAVVRRICARLEAEANNADSTEEERDSRIRPKQDV